MDILYCTVSLLMNFYIVFADVDVNVTLTTPSSRASIWPKPTNTPQVYQEVKKEEKLALKINDSIGPSPNLTRRSGHHRPSPYDVAEDNIEWGWDKWCQLQPAAGDGHEQEIVYFYQAKTDSCQRFTYTGKNGNQNRFTSKNLCDQFCKGFTVLEMRTLTQEESCTLQPNPGNCLGLLYRYYYDINLKTCKTFEFGGCGGNPNRFKDKRTCTARCGGSGWPRARARTDDLI